MKRLVVLPILACTAGFADEEMNNFDQRLTALEQKMEDCKRPGRPTVCHWIDAGYHVTVAAGPIFWKAREDDLDFAIRSELGLAQNARIIRPNFDWDWGAKVALGYQVPKYKMDVNLNWTYLKTHAHRHVTTEAPASLLSVWSLPSIGLGAANDAHSKWKMNLPKTSI